MWFQLLSRIGLYDLTRQGQPRPFDTKVALHLKNWQSSPEHMEHMSRISKMICPPHKRFVKQLTQCAYIQPEWASAVVLGAKYISLIIIISISPITFSLHWKIILSRRICLSKNWQPRQYIYIWQIHITTIASCLTWWNWESDSRSNKVRIDVTVGHVGGR